MKFAITGRIRGKTQFNIEIEAASENHARALALVSIGSAQGISKSNIVIDHIEEVKDSK